MLRIFARDTAYNEVSLLLPVTLGNFKISQSVVQSLPQFNVATGETVTYTSIVPFVLNETLMIKNSAGTVVRTLVNASRSGATYSDSWSGTNDSGALLPDGDYYYVASVTDGSHTMTVDLTGTSVGYFPTEEFYQYAAVDPYNNHPLSITINVTRPSLVKVICSTADPVVDNCNSPNYCSTVQFVEAANPHTFTWNHIDSSGAYRPELTHCFAIGYASAFSKNAVMLYGSSAGISALAVTPAVVNPAAQQESISFNLSTLQAQPATVTVTFANRSSGSVLRTITVTGVPPGPVSIPWDCKADNGLPAAPDIYLVTVAATDSNGNTRSAQTLMTIQY
jgi:flagellar hook assembly protein FlgD